MEQIEKEELRRWAVGVYLFALTFMDDIKRPQDYGTGDILNMVEMHTLSMIAKQPGICITEVARRWNRTLGAASRNVDRLVSRGWVRKEKLPGNDKLIHLYPTEGGQYLSDLHQAYDEQITERMVQHMLEKHSLEELRTFFEMLDTLKAFLVERQKGEAGE